MEAMHFEEDREIWGDTCQTGAELVGERERVDTEYKGP
jgi:hypothetical protein